jgi:CO/xanthine dehydrogenase Mo-binding subunit
MRWDEHGWDNYSPATMWDIRAGVSADGKIVAFDATSFGPSSYNKTPTESQVGQATPTPGNGPADTNYSGSQYKIPNRRVIGKTVPTLNNSFKVSTLRAPNAMQTCFACEQVIDQLAYLAGKDPYLFRLENTTDAVIANGQWQWRDSLNAVAQAANWKPRVANSVKQTGDIRTGRGIALGGFAGSQSGIAAEIEVNMKSGKIVAKHMYASQVAGLTVAPSLVENQMSGSLIMGVSRALHEAVAFDRGRVTSLDWVTYPLLRFKDSPYVTTVPVQRLDLQASGSGEPPTAAVAAAIANAFFDATGVRLHKCPMTADSVRAELRAAGVV